MDCRLIAALAASCGLWGCSKSTAPEPPAESPAPAAVAQAPATLAPEIKLAAMREAVAAGRGASAVKHLRDPEVSVRRGAILAVAPDAGVGPEELFASLHDGDAEVRELAASALRSRGLSPNQVSFARQFSHPDPAERLALLNDLAAGAVPNPGPWLVRLGEDPVPAVRLGAARVASELGLKSPWIARLATGDADPAVRALAAYYRDHGDAVARTGHAE